MKTLKSKFLLVVAVYAVLTLTICALSLYGNRITQNTYAREEKLQQLYHHTASLRNATSQLAFRSATLFNHGKASNINDFLSDLQETMKRVESIDSQETSKFTQTVLAQIGAGIIKARNFYNSGEQSRGDATVRDIQVLSQKLLSGEMALQDKDLTALEAVSKRSTHVHNTVGKITSLLTLLSIVAAAALLGMILLLVIKPIYVLVEHLKKAAIDPGLANKFRMPASFSGEIGEAATALNSLLDATRNALDHAQEQTQRAQHSEARWKAIFNLSPDAIILLDQQSLFIADCNPATLTMLGESEEDITTRSAFDFHPHEREALQAFLDEIRDNGWARSDHLSCYLNEQYMPVSVVGVDMPGELDTDGRATMLYIRDMTEIIKNNEALKSAHIAAEQASEAKSAFLATMSHEIRTPLNGMMGMAQALAFSDLTEADADKVNTMVESGNMLLNILNDILDISKIVSGKMELSPVKGDIRHLVSQTRKLFAQQARDKGLAFTVNIDPDLPAELVFDPVRVRQCLTNLVSNAIKFTRAGQVSIAVSAKHQDDQKAAVTITVSDTGIGMDEETRARVFGTFEQADNSISRRFGGTGLGLAISRELALMMDGEISVESTPGEGSAFCFSFQAKPVASAGQTPVRQNSVGNKPVKTGLSGKKILVVDDSATNRKVIKTLLSVTGADITEAQNGQEALERLEAGRFDLVLLDMHMPVLNGPDTIAHIRSGNEAWQSIPVVAVTADVSIGENRSYEKMGLDGYVPKPIDQRTLFVSIFKSMSNKHQTRSADTASEPDSLPDSLPDLLNIQGR